MYMTCLAENRSTDHLYREGTGTAEEEYHIRLVHNFCMTSSLSLLLQNLAWPTGPLFLGITPMDRTLSEVHTLCIPHLIHLGTSKQQLKFDTSGTLEAEYMGP